MSDAALREVLDDEDRTPIEGARPVVSLREDDEAGYRAALERHGRAVVELERRGRWHGRWVELDESLDPRARLPRPALRRRRWKEARPVVWRGRYTAALPRWRNELFEAERARGTLSSPQGLGTWLRRRLPRGANFALESVEPGGADPERDLATARLLARDGRRGPEPWVKVGRLSTHPDDASLRLRLGFGREPDDDASGDAVGQRRATGLARAVLPELAIVDRDRATWDELADLAGEPLGPSCPIAYWNRPGGGALFHHDAFAAVEPDGQRGVLFVQLAGATAWLALSTSQLARRVLQFAALLDEGALPWVRSELAPTGALDALVELGHDPFALADELGLPGQGRLGPLVDRGPEFTTFLADLGHAAVLRAGDAIVLPNHGWRATAMHSVLCASDGPNYALSLGLRPRGAVGA